jgi:hypothetical protein
MTMELDREVSLTRDLAEYGLRAGDIATLVDFVPHPNNIEQLIAIVQVDKVAQTNN